MLGFTNDAISVISEDFDQSLSDTPPLRRARVCSCIIGVFLTGQVVYDFVGEDDRMLTVHEGDILIILGEQSGWLIALTESHQEGFVPPDFVEEIDDLGQAWHMD